MRPAPHGRRDSAIPPEKPVTVPILTLEPLIDAVREGVEGPSGWVMSGLQKTSSTEFGGEWEGHTTRSAYLFFHHDAHEDVSVEGYLDETDQGLRGTISLVADIRALSEITGVPDTLDRLARLAGRHLPGGYSRPISLRLRLKGPDTAAADAQLETRIKVRFPGTAMEAGVDAVAALASTVVVAFEGLLADPESAEVLEGV